MSAVNVDRPNSFFLRPVTADECLDLVVKLKNVFYLRNTLPVNINVHVRDIIAVLIARLINIYFLSGTFPDALKLSTITPIFKSGDPLDVANYRPISVLPLFSKNFKRCVTGRLVEFSMNFL